MALRDYKYEQYEEAPQGKYEIQASRYHDYKEVNENSQKFNELMFFLNIVIFSIACVLGSFIFLSMKMNSVLALSLSLPIGLISLQTFRMGLKYYRTKNR